MPPHPMSFHLNRNSVAFQRCFVSVHLLDPMREAPMAIFAIFFSTMQQFGYLQAKAPVAEHGLWHQRCGFFSQSHCAFVWPVESTSFGLFFQNQIENGKKRNCNSANDQIHQCSYVPRQLSRIAEKFSLTDEETAGIKSLVKWPQPTSSRLLQPSVILWPTAD